MSDWQNYLIMQIARDASEIKASLQSVKSQLEEMTTWLQRAALLVFLWGAGVATNLNPERTGEVLASVIKSLK